MNTNNPSQREKTELAKDFKIAITDIENGLRNLADGKNVIVGTKENPIVPDNDLTSTKSIFVEGVYVREMTVKQGSVILGAIHKHEHISFLTKGHLTVISEKGKSDHVAPCTIIAGAGAKRMAYANEDSVWHNVHGNPSNTRDLKKLENQIIVASYEEYEEYIKNK